ncbi:MAG TPA: cysteine synthase family protein [candidate division Zixibacteria bacterium]
MNRTHRNDLLSCIGHTPLVPLRHVTTELPHEVLAKLEYLNPSGSIKDRMALYIIERAEREGLIKPGELLIDNSSGNTAVAVAMVAAVKGYRSLFTVPDKTSTEKIDLIRAVGAEVVVCPTDVPAAHPDSYYSTARRLAKAKGAYLIDQYHNPWNIDCHAETTGPEIWEQTDGEIDVLVAGIGTGGTLSGVGRFLKTMHPSIKVIAVDPVGSIFHNIFHDNIIGEPGRYKVEGIGTDTPTKAMDFSVVDEVVQVTDKEGFSMARRIVREEGMIVGGSSGYAVAGMCKWLEAQSEPLRVVTILPDSGMRYLSKFLSDTWMAREGLS